MQIDGLNTQDLGIELYDLSGKLVQKTTLNKGASITYIDTKTLYAGTYFVKIIGANSVVNKKVIIEK